MKDIYLIGESIPEQKRTPWPENWQLEPLDPRHGVFPNLVMTPLLSALVNIESNHEPLIKRIQKVLKSGSGNRLNIFSLPITKQKNDQVVPLDEKVVSLFRSDTSKDIYLIFGYWTAFAAIKTILVDNEGTPTSQREIDDFSKQFCGTFGCKSRDKAAKTGFAFQLIGRLSRNNQEIRDKLKAKYEAGLISNLCSIIPLLHNDAYQNTPIGRAQYIFMKAQDPPMITDWENIQPYWDYIGHEIAERVQM